MAMEKLDSLVKVRILKGDSDYDFLVLMIEHHKSWVEIADAELEFVKDDELKAIVSEMKAGAVKQIAELEALLEKNY